MNNPLHAVENIPTKEDGLAFIAWYIHSLEHPHVEILMNTKTKPLEGLEYDALIVATGALQKLFNLGNSIPVISMKKPLCIRYHGEEWGAPENSDQKLYELWILKSF